MIEEQPVQSSLRKGFVFVFVFALFALFAYSIPLQI